mgnify:CR=1 FL=1
MKKDIPYRDQLIELSKLYKIEEIKSYLRSKKHLTTSQIELVLLKNKIPLPEHSYNRKKIAEIKFKEQVTTNIVITLCLLAFVASLVGVRPHIKTVTNEIKFTYIAQDYKSSFKEKNEFPETSNLNRKKRKTQSEEGVSLDTQITLNLFENLRVKRLNFNGPRCPFFLEVSKILDKTINSHPWSIFSLISLTL